MAETDAARFDAHFAEARAQLLAELNDFIRIPSVSALPAHREDMVRAAEWVAARLRAAVAISADSAMWSQDGPSLVVGSKGLAGLQLDARGASGDLHSGLHGGMAPNPLNALATVVASMKAPDGRITIEGFFDGVRPLTEQEVAEIAAIPFDEAAYAASI